MNKIKLLLCVIFGQVIFIQGFSQVDGSAFPPVANIISVQTKMVMDLPAGTRLNNASIISYEHNSGVNQLWCLYKKRKGYVILSLSSKKVLAVNRRDSILVQQDYNKDKLQYWEILSYNDTLQIYNKATRLFITCLIENDTLKLMPNRGDDTQKWFIIEPWDSEIVNKIKTTRRRW